MSESLWCANDLVVYREIDGNMPVILRFAIQIEHEQAKIEEAKSGFGFEALIAS